MRLLRLVALAGLLALGRPAAADPPDDHRIVRDVRTCDWALRVIDARSIVRSADAVLVVFDAVTFSSPPGQNEFFSYHEDVGRWLDALGAWVERREGLREGPGGRATAAPRGGGPVHASVTFSRRPLRIGSPGWRKRLESHLARPW